MAKINNSKTASLSFVCYYYFIILCILIFNPNFICPTMSKIVFYGESFFFFFFLPRWSVAIIVELISIETIRTCELWHINFIELCFSSYTSNVFYDFINQKYQIFRIHFSVINNLKIKI